MNQLFRATCLFLLLSAPQIASAQTPERTPSRAWQQTWQLARQHFPSLQATEFGFEQLLLCQAGTPQEFEAFANSKYTYRDAEILASFWKEGLDQSKAHIGRKVLFGGASVDVLDQDLRAGRNQALAAVNQLRFFNESYSFRDAEALARFWKEASPWDAKLRLERKVIAGEEAIVQNDLQRALTMTAPAPSQPQNQSGGLTGNPQHGQGGTEKFYDSLMNFGLDIPPGWQRQATGPDQILSLNKNGSTFEVAAGPAPDAQTTVTAARNHLVQRGAQILNQYSTRLGGLPATRVDYSVPGQRRFGQMVICVTSRNQAFLVGAESNNLTGFPIGNDLKSMFQSFLINAR